MNPSESPCRFVSSNGEIGGESLRTGEEGRWKKYSNPSLAENAVVHSGFDSSLHGVGEERGLDDGW